MLSGCEERYEKIRVLVNKANSVVQGAIRIQEKNIIIKELKDDKTKLETELEDVEKKKSKEKSWRRQGQVRRKDFLDNLKTSSQEQNFVCDKCDVRFETMADLKNHERIIHMNGFSSQTENKVLVDKKVKYDKLVFSVYSNFCCKFAPSMNKPLNLIHLKLVDKFWH